MANAEAPGNEGGSPTSKLNSAISDFAASFVKTELEQLSEECDETLARTHAPKIRSLLLEVDKERQAFEDARKKMLESLHKKLEALDVDDKTIDSVISELEAMYPAYLNAIPRSTVLDVRPSSSARSSSSDSQLSSLGDSVDIENDQDNSEKPMQSEIDKKPNGGRRNSQRKGLRSRKVSADNDVHERLAAVPSGTQRSRKRSRNEAFGPEVGVDSTPEVRAHHSHR